VGGVGFFFVLWLVLGWVGGGGVFCVFFVGGGGGGGLGGGGGFGGWFGVGDVFLGGLHTLFLQVVFWLGAVLWGVGFLWFLLGGGGSTRNTFSSG